MGRLEQFDRVAGGVGEQDLASAWARDHVAAEGWACVAEPGDLGGQVTGDQVDAVAADRVGVGGVARAPERAGPDSSSRSGPRTHVRERGCGVFSVKPR